MIPLDFAPIFLFAALALFVGDLVVRNPRGFLERAQSDGRYAVLPDPKARETVLGTPASRVAANDQRLAA